MDLDAAHAGAVLGFWDVQTEEGMAMVTELSKLRKKPCEDTPQADWQRLWDGEFLYKRTSEG